MQEVDFWRVSSFYMVYFSDNCYLIVIFWSVCQEFVYDYVSGQLKWLISAFVNILTKNLNTWKWMQSCIYRTKDFILKLIAIIWQ